MFGRRQVHFVLSALMLSGLPLLSTVVADSPAQAHRDGCHAAHSCPSDSGSYVCGDTGNFSECGGSVPSVTSAPEPEPVYDFDPPRRPRFASVVSGARGLVQIPVQAERGSRLVIRTGSQTVATLIATGELQTITLHATTGVHVYRATATDVAGNDSGVGTVRVQADATPPAIKSVDLTPASPTDSRSRVSVVTDPATTYRLVLDGHTAQRGVSSDDGIIEQTSNLSNGHHQIALTLRDKAGNERLVSRALDVRVPTLDVVAQALSEPRDASQVFQITGTPDATATVSIPGGPAKTVRLTNGSGEISFSLSDGTYRAPVATLVDRHGRRGLARLTRFVVDTSAPNLRASALKSKAEVGLLALLIAGERGSDVAWTVKDTAGHVVQSARYTAEDTAKKVKFDVPEGEYDIELTATDEHGNETTRQFETQVAADPLTPGDVTAGLAALVVTLLVLAALGWMLWRNRRRIAAWREQRRARAAELARQRQHAAAIAAHNTRLANHRAATEQYQRADVAWNQRRQQLITLLALARTATGADSGGYANVKLKRDEKVYCTVPGAMVDMRTRQGVAYPAVVDHGQVTVTATRVVFNGTKKREWAYDKLEAVQHVGNDQTMMKVTNRKNASGVTYTDPETTRTYIELAIADTSGSRESVIEKVGQRLHAHEHSRPSPPAHPGPPPEPPQPLDGQETYAGQRR